MNAFDSTFRFGAKNAFNDGAFGSAVAVGGDPIPLDSYTTPDSSDYFVIPDVSDYYSQPL